MGKRQEGNSLQEDGYSAGPGRKDDDYSVGLAVKGTV